MDDGDVGDFTIVYDGLNYPNVLKHMVTGLITGREYQFKLSALNFNGPSLLSNPAAFTICASPSLFDPPRMTVYTKTGMTLSWDAPLTTGGCPILSYSIYKYSGSAWVEIDAVSVNNLPAKRSHALTFTTTDTGVTFRFYMTATNSVGFV